MQYLHYMSIFIFPKGNYRLILSVISFSLLFSCQKNNTKIRFKNGDIIVFAGGTNVSNFQKNSYLETMLVANNPSKKLQFRNLGWEGDTVYEQYRQGGFGEWATHLNNTKASILIAQFGQMESLDGEASIPRFIEAYKQLLSTARGSERQIVLLSPTPFDPTSLRLPSELLNTVPITNAPVDKYAAAIQRLATDEGCMYINLYDPLTSETDFTNNGIHLTENSHKTIAQIIMKALQLPSEYEAAWEPLRKTIVEKNDLWFQYWRAGNWAFIDGGEYVQQFSRDWKDRDHRILPEERNAILPLLESAELSIEKIKQKY